MLELERICKRSVRETFARATTLCCQFRRIFQSSRQRRPTSITSDRCSAGQEQIQLSVMTPHGAHRLDALPFCRRILKNPGRRLSLKDNSSAKDGKATSPTEFVSTSTSILSPENDPVSPVNKRPPLPSHSTHSRKIKVAHGKKQLRSLHSSCFLFSSRHLPSPTRKISRHFPIRAR